MLKVAYNYIARRPGYKMINTNIMTDVLQFCDKNFKSFYFEGATVMHKKYDHPEEYRKKYANRIKGKSEELTFETNETESSMAEVQNTIDNFSADNLSVKFDTPIMSK